MLTWKIGNVRITRVVELTTASIGAHILPDATPENLAPLSWLEPFLDQNLKPVLSMHSLVIESEGETIIVDTCIGNHKQRNYPKWNQMQSNFLGDLEQAGYVPDRVNQVLCTHLHVDHVGWNTSWVDDKWVPTFSNAKYVFGRDEFEFWRKEEQEYGPVFEDSVAPIFDAGLANLVESTHEVTSEIKLMPTPGHTPGHVSVFIESLGEKAVITGDLMHHPCQIARSHWACTADHDPQKAHETRANFLQTFADEPVLIIGTHFAGPTAGRIVKDGDSYRLDY